MHEASLILFNVLFDTSSELQVFTVFDRILRLSITFDTLVKFNFQMIGGLCHSNLMESPILIAHSVKVLWSLIPDNERSNCSVCGYA